MKRAFNERREYFLDRASRIDGISCVRPKGAFYVFMNIKSALGSSVEGQEIRTSEDFAAALLKYGLVAVVPGTAFGCDGYIRWSYATGIDNIQKGLDRLEAFLQRLSR